jgi:hypothetical protein
MTSQMTDVLECDLKDESSDSNNGGDDNHPEEDPENDGDNLPLLKQKYPTIFLGVVIPPSPNFTQAVTTSNNGGM